MNSFRGPSLDSGRRLSVAVVLPAHNEAAHIGGVLRDIPSLVDKVIVVDDASTDNTAEIAEECGDERVVVVRHERNSGVGAATKTGYRIAIEGRYDLVAKIDADGQMRGIELERLLEPFNLGMADYAKGNRFYFRDATLGMPLARSFGNSALSFLTKLASGYWHVFDSQCGFTVASTPFLELLDLDQIADGYFFENDMLIRMNSLNARVVDVPVSTIYGDEVSGVSISKVVASFPPKLLAGGLRRFWRKNLVTDFGPIGALTVIGTLLVAFGALFGAYHWWLSVVTAVAATTGTVMIAVLPLILGLQLLIQAFSMSVVASPGAAESAEFVRVLVSSRSLERASERQDRGKGAEK